MVAIEEAILCNEETDVVGCAPLPHFQRNVRSIAVVEHSLQTAAGGARVKHSVKRLLERTGYLEIPEAVHKQLSCILLHTDTLAIWQTLQL